MSKKKRLKMKEQILDLQEFSGRNWDTDFKIKSDYTFNYLQESFLQTILRKNTQMVFCDGPAGSAKTYIGILAALKLLSDKQVDNIVYIRSIVESASRSMGALPGEVDEKFAPWSAPLIDKLEELVSPVVKKNLMQKGFIKCIPVNFTRGLTFRNSVVIVDEAQNMTKDELTTILTRFGKNSKYIVVGDSLQSDINGKSGFKRVVDVFNDEESDEKGIYSFKFTQNEVVRSEILKFIVSRLEKLT